MPKIYYDRLLPSKMSQLIAPKGELRWLVDFVKENEDLDFLVGSNLKDSWISVYRGLSRLIRLRPTPFDNELLSDADGRYSTLMPSLYGNLNKGQLNFKRDLQNLLNIVRNDNSFDKHYNSKKEGYYQNHFSRRNGIIANSDNDFVIVDKEAEPVFKNDFEKQQIFDRLKKKYNGIYKILSETNPIKYGKNLEKKSIGKAADFLALDKKGRLLVIEFKHHESPAGIYLSPVQLGLYFELFTMLYKQNPDELNIIISNMVGQKQDIGLIPNGWFASNRITELVPVLVISEYNSRSNAKDKFKDVIRECRSLHGDDFLEGFEVYGYTTDKGLQSLDFNTK